MQRRRRKAASLLAVAIGVGALTAPGSALATQVASISAKISPLKPGAHAALTLGFHIRTLDGSLPSALTGLVFHYPRSLGIGSSELGQASCNPQALQVRGPKACPPNSIMGHGPLAEFQVSPEISEEAASIALVAGPSSNGYVKMLISATGVFPVEARIVMSNVLPPGRLRFSVPLVPGIPEGPDVAVVNVKATIGGHLTYYTRRNGRRCPTTRRASCCRRAAPAVGLPLQRKLLVPRRDDGGSDDEGGVPGMPVSRPPEVAAAIRACRPPGSRGDTQRRRHACAIAEGERRRPQPRRRSRPGCAPCR